MNSPSSTSVSSDPVSGADTLKSTGPEVANQTVELGQIESEVVDFFMHLSVTFSLPKSVGGLFGLLYCATKPIAFEDICAYLNISRGSTSHGLRFLQSVNAVDSVFQSGDRRTFYVAQPSLRRIVSGFLETRALPQLQSVGERIDSLQATLADTETQPQFAEPDVLRKRLAALHSWQRKAKHLMPMIAKIADPGD